MANTQNYINHLLQGTGITPACSEEERLAAEDIAQIFRNHGFDPEVQEFNAPAPSRLLSAPFFTCSNAQGTPWFRAWARRA